MKFSLRRKVAKRIVIAYFNNSKDLLKMKEAIQLMEKDDSANLNISLIRKIKVYIRKTESNNAIVERYLRLVPIEKRDHILFKYKNLYNDRKISANTGIPLATLDRWRDDFLEKIAISLFGGLTFDFIIEQYKEIDDIIRGLDEDIFFYNQYPDIVDKGYIEKLIKKRNYFYDFYEIVNNILNDLSNKEQAVVRMKLMNSTLTAEEIADRCNITRVTVSNYLNEFKRSVQDEI